MTTSQPITTPKVFNNFDLSVVLSFAFKVVGAILVLGPIINVIIAALPLNVVDRQWQLIVSGQLIEQSALLLIGLLFLLTSSWIDSLSGLMNSDRSKVRWNMCLWVPIFSTALGLLLLLALPIHLNNLRLNYVEAFTQVNDRAKQEEAQLETQIQAEIAEKGPQFILSLANPSRLEQAVQSGQISPEEAEKLRKIQKDPKLADQYLQEQADKSRKKVKEEIENRRQEALKQTEITAVKTATRSGMNSALSIIACSAIGWVGLRNLGRK